MGTIDMSQVAGFKAVDAEGNELGVVSMSELTASISEQVMQTIAMRNQANTLEQPVLMSSASTLATGNDAYENELQQVSDANWVRALLADGTPVLWNKSDLASVVGGLLKLANENGTIGTYGELKDFNQCTKNGYYRVMGKSEDILNACPITYGIMDVRGENEPYKLQVVFDLTKKQIAYRMYGDSKWNEWYVY